MKKLFMVIPLVFLLCFTFSCQPVEEVTEEAGVKPLSDEDIAAVKAIGPTMDKAALAGDWEGIAALCTEDMMLMAPNGPSLQGRSALLGMLESSGMTVTEHVVELVEVDGYGDIAYARGNWVEVFSIEGVEDPFKDEGKVVGIFRKQSDGTWLIAIWIYNSDLPLSE
jgi:uncharacterized protein (TIGR02246 family)